MDAELSRAESDLATEEAALHAELSKLAAVRGELEGRLQGLKSRVVEAGDLGLIQRASTKPPLVDADAAFASARSAREVAVRARRETNAAVRGQAAALKAQFHKLAQQLASDEKEAAALEEKARRPVAAQPAPIVPSPAPAPVAKASAPEKPIRKSPRVKMQAAVDFHSDNNFYSGFSANLSDGGLFVATVNLVPLGTEVEIAFSLPSGERIEAKGIVRWVREVNDQHPDTFPGLGVQFSALKPEAQSAIDQFLAQRDPLFYAEAG